jgi:hypothetical protein
MAKCTREQKIELAGLIFAMRTRNCCGLEIPEEAYKEAARDADKLIKEFPLPVSQNVPVDACPIPTTR